MPTPYERWRRRRLLRAALAACAGFVLLLPVTNTTLEVVAWCAVVLVVVRECVALDALARGTLRAGFVAGRREGGRLEELERLAATSRDARACACVTAMVAREELERGDPVRGRALFSSLRSLGWTPKTLVSDAARTSAEMMDALATMAAVSAVGDDLERARAEAQAVAVGSRTLAGTRLRAILMLRLGRPRRAVEAIATLADEAPRDPSILFLRDLARACLDGAPYRRASELPALRSARVGWLAPLGRAARSARARQGTCAGR
jgi:hypothetical protein